MNNKLFRKFNRIVIVFILFLLLFPFAENPVFSSNWPNNDESLLAGPIKEVMPIGDKVVYYGENGKTKEDLGLPAQVDIMLEDGSTLSGVDVD